MYGKFLFNRFPDKICYAMKLAGFWIWEWRKGLKTEWPAVSIFPNSPKESGVKPRKIFRILAQCKEIQAYCAGVALKDQKEYMLLSRSDRRKDLIQFSTYCNQSVTLFCFSRIEWALTAELINEGISSSFRKKCFGRRYACKNRT